MATDVGYQDQIGDINKYDFRTQTEAVFKARKGLTPLEIEESNSVSARLGEALDRWADHVEHHVNWRSLFQEL